MPISRKRHPLSEVHFSKEGKCHIREEITLSGAILLKSQFEDLKLVKRGKVRDVYGIDDKLLIVASGLE